MSLLALKRKWNVTPVVFFFFFADGVVAEIERKITEAFEAFDHEGSETVDVRFVNIFT